VEQQMKLESSEQMPDPALDSLGRPYSEPRRPDLESCSAL
jgi:hypothetical protein